MEVRRTVRVKLDVTERDAALLHETIEQFRDAANYVVRHARDDDVLSVGGQVDFDAVNGNVDSSTWSGMSGSVDTSFTGGEVRTGHQYSVQVIDTESQRVIYETTITA